MKLAKFSLGVMVAMSLLFASCGKNGIDRGKEGSVRAAYFMWVESVEKSHGMTGGVVSLYAQDAILLPTLSPKLCTGKNQINEYFIHFLSLKNLQVHTTELVTREYGDIAMNTGFYNFFYMKDGKREEVKARFDFWYKKVDGKWMIIFHQSSIVPNPMSK